MEKRETKKIMSANENDLDTEGDSQEKENTSLAHVDHRGL